ncbi:MAG: DUF4422 domain-containing protein [Clostridiales bacterium]|nr:DUF4422 domain-containing protein [Clostridiales bacterium]
MLDGRIIIFGMGLLFQKRVKQFDISKVIAITDNNKSSEKKDVFGIPVILPEEIRRLKYDFIVICTGYEIAEEIYLQLTKELQVPETKILSDRKFFEEMSWEPRSLLKVCRELGISTIADDDGYFYNHGILSNTNVRGQEFADIAWGKMNNAQVMLLPEVCGEASLRYAYNKLQEYKDAFRIIMFPVNTYGYEWLMEDNEYDSYCVYALDLQLKIFRKKEEVSIYVITHKNFSAPIDKMYTTLWVGDKRSCSIPCLSETGDNISYLNPKINECTGIYWIWKNTKEEIVGLNHYRRYFKTDMLQDILSEKEVRYFLDKYDILVYNATCTYPRTNSEFLRESIDAKAFECAMLLVKNAIMEWQPDYKEAFDRTMEGHAFFPCNMFITRREIYDRYCEWLFSIIIPAAENFDATPYDDYSKRAIGFFAERLLTVWLYKNSYCIKELPVLLKDTTL